MKELKLFVKFSNILDDMLIKAHNINNKYQLNPDLKLEDIESDKDYLLGELETIHNMCLERLNGTPTRYFDFKRHLSFSHACDYQDILNHDYPALKKWIVDKILDPKNQAFIAMSFTIPNRAEVQEALEKACFDCGYKALTVDKEEFNGGITDKIVEMIDRSKFVIADFTEQKGGVYYEAGLAQGQGKPVIYCVHESDGDKTHFDIKHINQIRWRTSEDLKERVKKRINETIV